MTQNTGMYPIRDRRLQLGMSQQALADACTDKGAPVSDSQISKIERGVCSPYPPLRAALAEILGMDIYLQRHTVGASR